MLNLDETLDLNIDYIIQKDLLLKIFFYSIGVLVFIDILRSQVPEINLLQLIPGFYLLFLFFSFIFLIFFSDFFVYLSTEIENKKTLGTKTVTKLNISNSLKIGFLFFLITFIISLKTVIPISLDSFNSYGEKTLENLWSFSDLINLEIILLLVLLLIAESPMFLLIFFNNEKDNIRLPKFWKSISLLIFIIAGFLTPTIDGYTQLIFAGFSFSFYILIINFISKRIIIKFNGNSILG